MRIILILSALILSITGDLLAGSEYDRCIKEEMALKAKGKDACSGLSYILNPSGCFAAQKALKEYTSSAKCRKIGVAEKVDFNASARGPANKAAIVGTVVDADHAAVNKAALEAPHQEVRRREPPLDEIARLKEEISRLKAENEQLRQRCGE